ncbi:MAG: hypothetical protein R6V84_10875 [Desulfobacterales bacterium]
MGNDSKLQAASVLQIRGAFSGAADHPALTHNLQKTFKHPTLSSKLGFFLWERHLAAIGLWLEATPTTLNLLADEPPAHAACNAKYQTRNTDGFPRWSFWFKGF